MELSRDFYVGVVEDNNDPNRKGRIKIRVQTLYHNMPVNDIPYAYPFAGLGGKEFQVPAIGKLVNVLFLSDDLYSPYYIYSENYNENLQRKLNSLSDEEYVNFTALLFDESTQIHVHGKVLTIDQLLNKFTIDNSTINLELKDNQQILNLGSRDAEQEAVLGTRFFNWMDKFISELVKPYSIIDSNGANVLKPKIDKLCQQYQQLRPDFVSNNVKIVDNGGVKILARTPDTINVKNDINLVLPPEENPAYDKALHDAIMAQNNAACQTLKDAGTSTVVFSPKNNSDKVWDSDSQHKINTLHPQVRPYVIAFLNKCQGNGIKLKVTSAYRSIETQKTLVRQGKPAAKAGFSFHNYGLAIDVKTDVASQWETVGEIGQSLGFRWGKFFRNPMSERWHFDMGFGLSTVELKKRYEHGDLIDGFVNLGESNVTNNQSLNGQDYVVNSDNSNCDAGSFNGGTATKSDEGEVAPTKEEQSAAEAFANLPCKDQASKILLDRIAKGEGTTDAIARSYGYNSAYDITYAYGKYTPKYIGNKKVDPITSLTLGEIKKVQAIMINNGANSTPMGRYQIISTSLPAIQKALSLNDNVLFSPTVQDQMAIQLLVEKRGYNKWLNGQMTNDAFQENLAREWASIASPKTGKSHYAGQPAGTSDSQIKEAMAAVKNQLGQCSQS